MSSAAVKRELYLNPNPRWNIIFVQSVLRRKQFIKKKEKKNDKGKKKERKNIKSRDKSM